MVVPVAARVPVLPVDREVAGQGHQIKVTTVAVTPQQTGPVVAVVQVLSGRTQQRAKRVPVVQGSLILILVQRLLGPVVAVVVLTIRAARRVQVAPVVAVPVVRVLLLGQ